jgi:hypothetical protein
VEEGLGWLTTKLLVEVKNELASPTGRFLSSPDAEKAARRVRLSQAVSKIKHGAGGLISSSNLSGPFQRKCFCG